MPENEALAKAAQLEEFFSIFKDLKLVFQASTQARAQKKAIDKDIDAIMPDLLRLRKEKDKEEKELTEFKEKAAVAKQAVNKDSKENYSKLKAKAQKVATEIEGTKTEHEAVMKKNRIELDNMIRSKTQEITDLEKTLASVKRDIAEVKGILIGV